MDDLTGLWTRRKLLAEGYCDSDLRRWLAGRRADRPRRGTYLSLPDDRMDAPESRHALAVRAAMGELPAGAVVSHVSAAVLYGLPIWGIPLRTLHVSRNRAGGGRARRGVHLHTAPWAADETVEIDGIPVTAAARTIVDLARSVPFEQAVALADAALYRKLTTPAELAAAVTRAARRPGNAAARRVVAFADGRSESVGESRSRVAFRRLGLPPPELQVEVRGASGRQLGRVDFWWAEYRTVGEFDGKVKYGRLLRPGQQPGDVVFEEKVREDDIRDTDRNVARWIWRELPGFESVAARLRRAFARS